MHKPAHQQDHRLWRAIPIQADGRLAHPRGELSSHVLFKGTCDICGTWVFDSIALLLKWHEAALQYCYILT